VNVAVTPEQHTLLLQLAALQNRSAASFLREMLDAVTPLLRATVPALQLAAEEMELTRSEAIDALREPLERLRELGMVDQLELLGSSHAKSAAPGMPAASGSERGRPKRRRSTQDQ
jgi:hypothetical protein